VKRSPLTIGTSDAGTPEAVATLAVFGVVGASVPSRACGSSAMYGTPAGVTPPLKAPPRASDTVPSLVVARKKVRTSAPATALRPARMARCRVSSLGRIHGNGASAGDSRSRQRSIK
jgi:hypothetical protein